MDEVIVTSKVEKKFLKTSGVVKPIKVVGQSLDMDKFSKEYKPIIPELKDHFIFYFIGEFIPRKGLAELLTAYYSEFNYNEDVHLIVKTNGDPNQIDQFFEGIKQTLGMYSKPHLYPKATFMHQFLAEIELDKLHAQSDCFVMPSYGESWCLPAMEAMGFGNTPIVTRGTGMEDFITPEVGYIIDSEETIVSTTHRPLADLYTGHETWMRPSILSLKKLMREAYQNNKEKSSRGKEAVKQYSHENIGKLYE
jgi:glycosyltransferase involved in cell wall biosynthesis